MKHRLLTVTCIASLALIANPASAQKREYSSGLNYTTLGTSQKKDTETADSQGDKKPEQQKLYNTIKPKQPEKAKPVEDLAEGVSAEADKEKPNEDPTVTIWNKYKDLAAGTAGEKDGEKGEQATKTLRPSKPEKPAVDKPATAAAGAAPTEAETKPAENAFGSILDQWQSSRDKQRDMRSKTFAVPDTKSN